MEVGGELFRLQNAIAGECRIGGYACWTADAGAVRASLGVNDPVGAVLVVVLVCSKRDSSCRDGQIVISDKSSTRIIEEAIGRTYAMSDYVDDF